MCKASYISSTCSPLEVHFDRNAESLTQTALPRWDNTWIQSWITLSVLEGTRHRQGSHSVQGGAFVWVVALASAA